MHIRGVPDAITTGYHAVHNSVGNGLSSFVIQGRQVARFPARLPILYERCEN